MTNFSEAYQLGINLSINFSKSDLWAIYANDSISDYL